MCVFVNLWGGGGGDTSGNEVAAKTHFHGSLCFSRGFQEWRGVMRPRYHSLRSLATTYIRNVATRLTDFKDSSSCGVAGRSPFNVVCSANIAFGACVPSAR